MKNKMKILVALVIIATTSVIYSFTSVSTGFRQVKTARMEDSIKRSIAISDSLNTLKSMKLKLYKKNAHASYYADKFNGRKTASGKKFSNSGYTAAHRKIPFGTKLKITNEANKKAVFVTVTDRGPFTKGRDIDLTSKAFHEIAPPGYGGSLLVTIEEVQ